MDLPSLHICTWVWMMAAAMAVHLHNPQKEWQLCGRPKTSFICDPDMVLSMGYADKLDNLAADMRRSTSCLCSSCSEKRGVSIGIYLKQNFTQRAVSTSELAEILRKRWGLGQCDDDIIVVILVQNNISEFSMGAAVRKILPQGTASKIFTECKVHFENGHFYQGLESIVSSFTDVLVKLQKQRATKSKDKSLLVGLILGIGVLVVLILFAGFFLYRYSRMRKSRQNKEKKDSFDMKKNTGDTTVHRKGKQYQLCQQSRSDDSDDEDSDSDVLYRKRSHTVQNPTQGQYSPFIQPKKHLSDVIEETYEDVEPSSFEMNKDLGLSMSLPISGRRNMQVTEL